MALPGGSLPRAARTETRVTGATFDPTRGGFSGANIDVRLGPGSRSYQQRNAFLTLDPSALQLTDAVGRSSARAAPAVRGSVGADGELIRRALTYNVALDVARSTSDPATLLDADAATLLRAGVSPDSVARLGAVTRPFGISPGAGVPGAQRRDAVTWLGRLDDTRDSLNRRTLTTYAGLATQGAIGFGPLAAPSAAGERDDRAFGIQLADARPRRAGAARAHGDAASARAGRGRRAIRIARSPARRCSCARPTSNERSDVTALSRRRQRVPR